jgi:PPOX class probable F420-dependent enzyme
VNRRREIQLTPEEARAFLDEQRTMTCATHGPRGFPHLMPLWYVLRGEELWAWTFAKSQKVRNLERDARATVQVEAGRQYHELRGVVLECEVELVRDTDAVTAVGLEIAARYGGAQATPEVEAGVRAQAAKRMGLRFLERRRMSWDHSKLGGGY